MGGMVDIAELRKEYDIETRWQKVHSGDGADKSACTKFLLRRMVADINELLDEMEAKNKPSPAALIEAENDYNEMRRFEKWLRCRILGREDEIKRLKRG